MPAGLDTKKPLGLLAFTNPTENTAAATGQKFQSVMFKERAALHSNLKYKTHNSKNIIEDEPYKRKVITFDISSNIGIGNATAVDFLGLGYYLKYDSPISGEYWSEKPNLTSKGYSNFTNNNTYNKPDEAILFGSDNKNSHKIATLRFGIALNTGDTDAALDANGGIFLKKLIPTEPKIQNELPEYGIISTTGGYCGMDLSIKRFGIGFKIDIGKSTGNISKNINGQNASDIYAGDYMGFTPEIFYRIRNKVDITLNYTVGTHHLNAQNLYNNSVGLIPVLDGQGNQVYVDSTGTEIVTQTYTDDEGNTYTVEEEQTFTNRNYKYNFSGVTYIENPLNINQRNSGVKVKQFSLGIRYTF